MERATDPCNIKHANESQFTASSQVQRKPWRPQMALHQLLHSQWSVVFDCDNEKCGDHFCALESLIISIDLTNFDEFLVIHVTLLLS